MQVLEPMLIQSDTLVASATGAEEEVDFNFAALEGALIFATQFVYGLDFVIADFETDGEMACSLNYNPAAAPVDSNAAWVDDFAFAFDRFLISSQSAVGLTVIRSTSVKEFHESTLIVRNPSFWAYATTGSPTSGYKLWYKRVIFNEQELVPFVALRR